MSDYQYHIFIGYRRSDEHWVRWTRENFARALRSTGESWSARLATALAHSRLLIPVLSRDYFQSNWCWLEFEMMSCSEQEHGFRTANKREVCSRKSGTDGSLDLYIQRSSPRKDRSSALRVASLKGAHPSSRSTFVRCSGKNSTLLPTHLCFPESVKQEKHGYLRRKEELGDAENVILRQPEF